VHGPAEFQTVGRGLGPLREPSMETPSSPSASASERDVRSAMELVVAGCCAMREDFDWAYPASKAALSAGSKDQALCAFRKLFFGVARLASIANRIGTNPRDRECIGEALDVLHADWSSIMAFVSALHRDGKVLSSQVTFLVSKLSLLSRSFEVFYRNSADVCGARCEGDATEQAAVGKCAPSNNGSKGPAWQQDASGLPAKSWLAVSAATDSEAQSRGSRAPIAVPIEVVRPTLAKDESQESLPAEGVLVDINAHNAVERFGMSCSRQPPAEISTPRMSPGMSATFGKDQGRELEPLYPVRWPDDQHDAVPQVHWPGDQHGGSPKQSRPSLIGNDDQLASQGDMEGPYKSAESPAAGDATGEMEAESSTSVASTRVDPDPMVASSRDSEDLLMATLPGATSAPASVRATAVPAEVSPAASVAAAYLRAVSPMAPRVGSPVHTVVRLRPEVPRWRSSERAMPSSGYVTPTRTVVRHRSPARSENEPSAPHSPQVVTLEDERAKLLKRGTVGQRVSALESKLRESQASQSNSATPSSVQKRSSRLVDTWHGSKSPARPARLSSVLSQARNACV